MPAKFSVWWERSHGRPEGTALLPNLLFASPNPKKTLTSKGSEQYTQRSFVLVKKEVASGIVSK